MIPLVCLSVCLSVFVSRIFQKKLTDLNEILCSDRTLTKDKWIRFWD